MLKPFKDEVGAGCDLGVWATRTIRYRKDGELVDSCSLEWIWCDSWESMMRSIKNHLDVRKHEPSGSHTYLRVGNVTYAYDYLWQLYYL